MTKLISITDAITGKSIVREMNASELSYIAQMEAYEIADKEKASQTAVAKAALLERLGITADEAALLLG